MPAKSKTNGSTTKRNRGLSRLRKPEDMSLEEWQVALRREFAKSQKFRVKNLGDEPLFSEFEVTNPETRRTYRVAIRGQALGENFCSCPDFAVNTLGTCKHIEFVLAPPGPPAGREEGLGAGPSAAVFRGLSAIRRAAGSRVPAGHGLPRVAARPSPGGSSTPKAA